ncbi:MAG TPA: cytochrome c oxidase assembly protein [Vicinamibacterales bacterium]|nr:cytochrome c oxidase assembly protein [Vicinamibacterales bacterium]
MLVISLLSLLFVYLAGVIRVWRSAGFGRGIRLFEAGAFGCGWVAIVIALWSPLDELSEHWIVAHMIQHELLMVVAAPLIAVSAPLIAMLWAVPEGLRRPMLASLRQKPLTSFWAVLTAPVAVFSLHAAALWVWHLPALYDYALEHEAVHVVQHACFFGSAALFWWGIAHGRYGRLGYGAAVVYVFATALHGGALGALLTFSPRVWYTPYTMNHPPGLTPLEDQQLAGLLMWVPAGILVAAGALVLFAAWLRESDRHTRYKSAMPLSPTP